MMWIRNPIVDVVVLIHGTGAVRRAIAGAIMAGVKAEITCLMVLIRGACAIYWSDKSCVRCAAFGTVRPLFIGQTAEVANPFVRQTLPRFGSRPRHTPLHDPAATGLISYRWIFSFSPKNACG
jgi:hypothetical protein